MRLRIVGGLLIALGLVSVAFYFTSDSRSIALGALGVAWIGVGAALLVRSRRRPPAV